MVGKISVYERLSLLEKRNNKLKSLLIHDQLKYGSYPFKSLEGKMLQILLEYKSNKSLIKSAKAVGIDSTLAIKWFIRGQRGDSNFKILYSGINKINNWSAPEEEIVLKKDYEIKQVGGSWIYTTYVDDEKISVISSDFDNLKEKVSNKNLPFDE